MWAVRRKVVSGERPDCCVPVMEIFEAVLSGLNRIFIRFSSFARSIDSALEGGCCGGGKSVIFFVDGLRRISCAGMSASCVCVSSDKEVFSWLDLRGLVDKPIDKPIIASVSVF